MTFQEIIAGDKDAMLDDIAKLVSYPSVCEYMMDNPAHPFGENVQACLEEFLSMAQNMGFATKNVDNFGAHVEWGEGEETLGIPVHLDVVPAGEGWQHEPFKATVDGGRLYGRGTSDNKGSAVSILYAMKALRDSGFVPGKRIRLILGLDEELDWHGMHYYFDREGMPEIGFTPDGDFPVTYIEKASVVFNFAKKLSRAADESKGITFCSMNGGTASNVVAGKAHMIIRAAEYGDIIESVKAYAAMTGRKISAKKTGVSLRIDAEGVQAHGAMPELGLNAISILMDFAKSLTFNSEDVMDVIEFYNRHLAFCTDGSLIGAGFKDEESGEMKFNIGVIEMNKDEFILSCGIRYPLCIDEEGLYSAMMPAADKYGIGIVKLGGKRAIRFEKDDPLVTTLMDCYRENTGDTESQPLVIGGASYARCMDKCVCFGMLFKGRPDTMHQCDEYIEIEDFMKSTVIYADAIARLTK